ncbi:MAG: hypothetical protein ACTHJ4_03300 [Candidatus Nucleicultricaceae bacterium]
MSAARPPIVNHNILNIKDKLRPYLELSTQTLVEKATKDHDPLAREMLIEKNIMPSYLPK